MDMFVVVLDFLVAAGAAVCAVVSIVRPERELKPWVVEAIEARHKRKGGYIALTAASWLTLAAAMAANGVKRLIYFEEPFAVSAFAPPLYHTLNIAFWLLVAAAIALILVRNRAFLGRWRAKE